VPSIDEIVINALDLAIDNGWLSNAAGTRIEVSGIAFDEELQRATLGLAIQPIPAPGRSTWRSAAN
jgi:hypothetical protein